MPAMTMEFAYGGRGRGAGRREIACASRCGSGPERSWIEDLEITGHTEPVKGDAAAASVARLHEGDRLPEMSLVDQDGLGMTGDDLEGHLTVVTFIFTRCPVPDYCPLMSRRFVQVQSALTADPSLPPDVRLLSITIDPAFDTAPVLKAYAQALGADPARWRFAGGDLAEVTARGARLLGLRRTERRPARSHAGDGARRPERPGRHHLAWQWLEGRGSAGRGPQRRRCRGDRQIAVAQRRRSRRPAIMDACGEHEHRCCRPIPNGSAGGARSIARLTTSPAATARSAPCTPASSSETTG